MKIKVHCLERLKNIPNVLMVGDQVRFSDQHTILTFLTLTEIKHGIFNTICSRVTDPDSGIRVVALDDNTASFPIDKRFISEVLDV